MRLTDVRWASAGEVDSAEGGTIGTGHAASNVEVVGRLPGHCSLSTGRWISNREGARAAHARAALTRRRRLAHVADVRRRPTCSAAAP